MSTHVTNKGLYFSIMVFGILIIGGFVYAYGGNQPAVMGHSLGELDWTQALVGNPFIFGKLSISRDNTGECCTTGDYTLSLAENSATTGKKSTIQFHNAGLTEGAIKLDAGLNGREFKVSSVQDNMDLHATGYVQGDQGLCIGTDCKTAWSQVVSSGNGCQLITQVKDGVNAQVLIPAICNPFGCKIILRIIDAYIYSPYQTTYWFKEGYYLPGTLNYWTNNGGTTGVNGGPTYTLIVSSGTYTCKLYDDYAWIDESAGYWAFQGGTSISYAKNCQLYVCPII